MQEAGPWHRVTATSIEIDIWSEPDPDGVDGGAGDSHEPRLHYGNMLKLPPQQIVAAIEERARQDCSPGAAAEGRHGEFRAVLRADHGREPIVDLEPNGTLNAGDERCVQLAAAGVREVLTTSK